MLMDILITVIVTSLCLIFYYIFVVFNYWPNKGVPNIKPTFPFGNIGDITSGKISFTDQIGEFYDIARHNKWKFVGLNFFHRKVLLIIDPNLAKSVLNTDFKHFQNRGIYYDEKNDPLTAHLVALNGAQWKKLRNKLTPTFTPIKLKNMFDLLLDCANEMSEVIKNEKMLEIKDVTSRYTTDVVGSTAFGINCQSLKHPDSEFRKVGMLATTPNNSKISRLKQIIMTNIPELARKLKLKILDPAVTAFFMKVVSNVVNLRQTNKIVRNDFLQLLINMMPSENLKTEDALNIQQVAAQCFVFFIAGVETSATTITFALYELAKNVEMQAKLREEINNTYEKYDGKLTYDGVLEMQYMEKVILETMRKYPAFTVIMRRCTEDYRLPDSDSTVEAGNTIIIPTYAMQNDPCYYPNPDVIDPERFSDEEIKKRSDSVYLPFGDGPRICIGRRFAMFQIKLALATSLRDFIFTLNEKSKGELEMDKTSFILSPVGGIYLDITPIVKEN